jgi:flagella basal body P-ring formation protein FlgA
MLNGKRKHMAVVLLCATLVSSGPGVAGSRSYVCAEDLRTAVRHFLAQRDAHAADQTELSFRSVPDSIPVDDVAFSLHVDTGTLTRMRGPMAFIIEVVAGERTVHRCMVTAVIRTYDTVLVADRTIARRATPGIDDIRMLRLETTGISRPLLSHVDDLFGKRSRRIITRGSILYEDLFEDLPLVHQGAQVNVRVHSGPVCITTDGIACQDGMFGELIEVSVQGKAGRVKARVADSRTVAVPVE